MTDRTDRTDMDRLHKALTDHLLKALKSPDVPVGLLKEVREFLADNGIQASEETRKAMALDFLGELDLYQE